MQKGATNQPRGFFDAREVIEAARGRWQQLLPEFGVNAALLGGRHGPCPGCGGRDRFRFDDKGGDGTFLCSGGGAGLSAGNGVELIIHVTGLEWKVVIEDLGRKLLPESSRKGFTGEVQQLRAPVDMLPAAPAAEPLENVPAYDPAKLARYIEAVPALTRADLRALSPVPVEKATAADFLEVLYGTAERVLIFTRFFSQGDFLYQVGAGCCRLGQEKGVKAVVSPMPTSAREGVWFLSNPVTGGWAPKATGRRLQKLPADFVGPPQMREAVTEWSRRTWQTVTSYRYAVLESDVVDEALWMRALVKLPVPIVAIYSSGGKSLHALVRMDAGDKSTWDLWVRGRNDGTRTRTAGLIDLVCPLGADAGALSAVRLTRLPFCFREGGGKPYARYDRPRLQELLYLNPMPLDRKAPWKSIYAQRGGWQ